MKTLTLALLLTMALPLQAQTQVYKCQIGGKTVFSDTPCAADATLIHVHPAAGHALAPITTDGEEATEEQNTESGENQPVSASEPDAANERERQEISEKLEKKKQDLEKLEIDAQTRLTQLEYEITQPDKREKAEKLLATLSVRYNRQLEKLREEISSLEIRYNKLSPPQSRE